MTKRLTVILILSLVVLSAGIAAALPTPLPSALDVTLGVSTDKSGPIQVSAFLSGGLTDVIGYKVGGWLITGSSNTKSFLGDAYLDFKGPRVYVAAGQKFVPFGPALGLLVSPGIRGVEAKVDFPRVTVQVITGRTQFSPVTGSGPRWTPSPLFPVGAVRPKEDMTAARVQFELSPVGAVLPIRLGVNALHTLGDTGYSADGEVGILSNVKLFGEAARFRSVNAWVVGASVTDLGKIFGTKRYTSVALYYRQVPADYAPAVVGATAYFPEQRGLVGGLYHELKPGELAIGVFTDAKDAIFTVFKHIPLR